jgi:hypothetical protein
VHQWSEGFGDVDIDFGHSVAVDGQGSVVVTGAFKGTVNFGGNNLSSAGENDIFLVKFGHEQPVITSIVDVRNDQGRKVRIQFERSAYDASAGPVIQYEAYRRNDALPASPTPMLTRAQPMDQGWVYAGSVPAHGVSDYLMDAPTDADSTLTKGQHYSAFFIRAATANPMLFYDSPVDSGYSLDNLAPGVPGSFAYNAGVLSWKKSTAKDVDHYTVYGSSTRCFCNATLVDDCVAPSMDVSQSPYEYYFVTATDASGNESVPAAVTALTGGTPTSYVLSISAYPNPFNPETTIRYTVPSKGHVNVSVYDARGAHVASLVNEDKAAGAYTQAWNGRDDAGQAVSSGVYFARVNHASGSKNYKVVLLK